MKILTLPEKQTRTELTPEVKFSRLVQKEISKNKTNPKKHHYKIIEDGDKIVLFNGLGEKIGDFLNSIDGIREARVVAVEKFCDDDIKNKSGGYLFN